MPSRCRYGEGYHGRRSNNQEQASGPPGYGRRHGEKDTQSKLGNLSVLAEWQRPAVEYISRRERPRGSDEAIVSDDLAGQYNLLASQGPLDRIALGIGSHTGFAQLARKGRNASGEAGLLAAYKLRAYLDEGCGQIPV